MKHITLKKRADFLRLRDSGIKAVRPDFIVQMAPSAYLVALQEVHVGFTVTKKCGNAVQRNRLKRRLRAAVLAVFPTHAKAECDYVLIGRKNGVHSPFNALCSDLESALTQLHRKLNT